ncbi:MAG: 3'(2'),5'-bisphosphate nucleotidase CysQ [Gammaproteobacteria bacterium]|nr:3'(2'),5'-bisphosphate nucleotidase CysQ [Gammaproteobacteria bacterium]
MTLLDDMLDAALAAGEEILRIRDIGFAIHRKPDASPVTAADQAAEALILARLARLLPDVPVVAEESVAGGGEARAGERFFLVDPLDGTREFVDGRDEFTVNIALVEHGSPVLGVVVAPALGRSFAGDVYAAVAFEARRGAAGPSVERRPLRVRTPQPGRRVAVASRSHGSPQTERWLAAQGVTDRVSIGSSLKFCLLAAGEADVYPRFGPTMEWDTAAGHAVLVAAGGAVLGPDGAPLAYGKPGFRNTDFVATAQPLR